MNEESRDNGFLEKALIVRLGAIIRLWLDCFGTHHGFLKKDAAIIEFSPDTDNEFRALLVEV